MNDKKNYAKNYIFMVFGDHDDDKNTYLIRLMSSY